MNFLNLLDIFEIVKDFGIFPAIFIIMFYFILRWADKAIDSREKTINRLFNMLDELRNMERDRLKSDSEKQFPKDVDKSSNDSNLLAIALPVLDFSLNTIIFAAAFVLLRKKVKYRKYTLNNIYTIYNSLTRGTITMSTNDGFKFALGQVLPYEFIPGQLVTSVALSDFNFQLYTKEEPTPIGLVINQSAYPEDGFSKSVIDLGEIPFEDVRVAPDSGYKENIYITEPGHSYIIKTKSNKYGKIRIIDLDLKRNKITFIWHFQPSGSKELFNNS